MKGLSSTQATNFLKQYGLNVISEPPKKKYFIKFIEQFTDFLTILLLIAAIFSFMIGEIVDAVFIILIVVLNALFGLYQEGKAEESLATLKKMTMTKARVVRDQKEKEIDSRLLVPGDIVYIEEGAKVAADGVVVWSRKLELNEASLTGESVPVVKGLKEEVFSGTIVTSGRAYIEIKKTGDNTKFGEIAKSLSKVKEEMTPLEKKLIDLTRFIGIGGIALALTVFLISFLDGSGYFPSFLLAVSLAVAVVPEGLPAVMTITLALGMKKMAGKKAIVKKLSAIEALGSVTLIATDKTGTLTENKMRVKEIYVDNQIFQIANNPLRQPSAASKLRIKQDTLDLLILNGILCSTASLVYVHDHGSYDVLGDPTEGALLYLAMSQGINFEDIRNEWMIIDEKPFDSVSKLMSVVVRKKGLSSNKDSLILSKGAPESIMNSCNLAPAAKRQIEEQVNEWAKKGLRVLAFSYSKIKNPKNETFLGMVAIHDAPRPEVTLAISKAKSAGIKVVMVTGDNEKTAEAIGVSCGLIDEGEKILTGSQIEKYSDEELLFKLPKVKIFARTNPFQKNRIVSLYQQLGEIVAVTGDGVNDAIALKKADVGIAMGQVGTDVARETADIIITDDNFATIVMAVEEGRAIINNIKNAIKYLLSCNVSEALALVFGLFLGLPTLFYPIQLLYINLVTDGLPALTLSFSPKDSHLMTISPQKELIILKKRDQTYIVTIGFVGSLLVILSYFIYAKNGMGRSAAFSVLTLIQSFIFIDLWLSHRPIHKNLHSLLSPLFIVGFTIPIVLQVFILSNQLTSGIFRINPAAPAIIVQYIFISFIILIGIKLVKLFIKV